MSNDILDLATRALREETADGDSSSRFTRARIMASLHKTERRRRSRAAFFLPIAAVMVGSTAFAASGGNVSWQRVAQAIGLAKPDSAPLAAPPEAPMRRSRGAVAVAKRAEPEPTPEPELEPLEPPKPETVVVTPETKQASVVAPEPKQRQPAASAPASAAPTVADEPTADPELESYRAAHRLHFGGGSPAAALAGWDRYLAESPRGRFTLEASYNRAMCLVRLGRNGEARRALEPFADGKYGSYRQVSAKRLLDALH